MAGLIVLLGTRDLESYEHVFFSLDRGTAVESVRVLGLPVYTLSIGLGVRLPLQASLSAAPAARLAPYLPGPLTYWLLLALSVAAAVLLMRRALEPVCKAWVSWSAATLLFCSPPMVAYTIYSDWPEVAVTYCAFVGCVFAPHALLALLGTATSATGRRLGWLSVIGTVWGLVGLSHPGYWPLLGAALVAAGAVALCRTDHSLRTRLAVVVALGIASSLAVGPQVPDVLRELPAGSEADGMRRYVDGPARGVIMANLFPAGRADPEMPFGFLVLALVSFLIGLRSRDRHCRRLIVGSAGASVALGIGAATLSPGSSALAPSSIWALRDPAAAFAVLAAAGAAGALRELPGAHRRWATRAAVAALVLAALQGLALTVSLVLKDFPRLADHSPWTYDLTSAEDRVSRRGLARDRVPPGARLALWPGVRQQMRNDRQASTDFADAGYLLATAWTKQRTMRGVVEPNEFLFDQSVDLAPDVLCDAEAIRFLQLRYLLRPSNVNPCAPWQRAVGLAVDRWLAVDVARSPDDRVRALALAHLAEPVSRRPALSSGSALLPLLVPLPGTSLTLTATDVAIQIEDLSVAAGHALVIPVAYDAAWRASSGEVRNVGGLLALVDVDEDQVGLEFVPDRVAVFRAFGMTVAQLLAMIGLLALALVGRVEEPTTPRLRTGVRRARDLIARTAPALSERRDWLYVAYTVAVLPRLYWRPEDSAATGGLEGLLLPITALTVARLAQSAVWHRWTGGMFLAFALLRVAAGGSLSAAALHDPLFWGLMATLAVGVSAVTGRFPFVAAALSAGAGVCLTLATLLPVFPEFQSRFPQADIGGVRDSFGALADQLGVLATMFLLGIWVQAIGLGGMRPGRVSRIDAAVRGALLAGLVLTLIGAVPRTGIDARWMIVLGLLLGLAEGRARQPNCRP